MKQGLEIPNGNAYRKVVCSYDICDWAFRESWNEYQVRAERYRKEYENGVMRWGLYRSFREDMTHWNWFKMYKMK
jgi:hypothetical protein